MTQRVFVKVVGFTDIERHALNSLFRLSEERETKYSLWDAAAPEPAKLALVDEQSYEAGLQLEGPVSDDMKLIWIGAGAPVRAWRTYERPLSWSEVVRSMDELFAPAVDLDFDLDSGFDEPQPPADSQPLASADMNAQSDAQDTRPPELDENAPPKPKRALIASPSRDERLYLRARLALANLTQADDAETAAQALELARDNDYAIALVDFSLPDIEGWALLKELGTLKRPIPCRVVIKSKASLLEYARAWLDRIDGLFVRPLNPAKLHRLFSSI